MNEEQIAALDEISREFNRHMEHMEEVELKQETYWNSLTKEQQLDVFCAVVRRIHKGELEEKGSYRYVLYDVFDFGPESYVCAQMAGYLDLHNCIYEYGYDKNLLREFCSANGIEDADQKIKEFGVY